MPIQSFDHVALAMPSGKEDEARAFYVGVLGFEETPKPAELAGRGGLWLRSANVAVHLAVEAVFRAAAKAHPAFACTGYAALLERLSRHGTAAAHDRPLVDGRAHCYVYDPFGNRLELIESPAGSSSGDSDA